MELSVEGGLLRQGRGEALRQEACELTVIMTASRLSASRSPVPNRKSKISSLILRDATDVPSASRPANPGQVSDLTGPFR